MSDKVGILGFGYLGNELADLMGDDVDVWATQQQVPSLPEMSGSRFRLVTFQWDSPETWKNLPDLDSILIITIPPLLKDTASEEQRLVSWCRWIKAHRPGFRRCIYISSTGVYPNLPGIWQEESSFTPDTEKGRLRLGSERTFLNHFNTTVVRPGAIYGDKRNIGMRMLAGKTIPGGEQPVHRIHVHDLARIVLQAATNSGFPDVLNAVDLESETTKNVARWLLQQPFFPKDQAAEIKTSEQFQTRKFNVAEPGRKISNTRLVEACGFQFVYPTYKEGLAHAFTVSRAPVE